MKHPVPYYRVILCMLGWHCTESIENGLKYRCVYCGTWDFWDEWISVCKSRPAEHAEQREQHEQQ